MAEAITQERAAEAEEATFPLRIACIDTGSNAIRYKVADFHTATQYQEVEEERLPVRLGHDVFLSGRLTAEAMERAVGALASIRRRLDDLGVVRYRAVATSAVRESANGDAFLARVREEAGIELEAITGSEEARLVYVAARSRVRLGRSRWVIVDVGGGSVEVLLVDSTGVLWSESHTMGAVRLLEELRMAADQPGRFQRLVAEYTSTLRISSGADRWKAAGLVATGGNIEALGKLSGISPDPAGVVHLPLSRLRALTETLASLSYAQRVEQLGLREDRADVILPAAYIYERIAEFVRADTLLVPNVGVKEGVLLDLAEDIATHRSHEVEQDRSSLAAAIALGRRYMFDEEHGVQVGRLSASLFDQLRDVHGLADPDRRILVAAAVLHDIGAFVSYKKHHKHSLYIIVNSELAGFAPREMLLIANIARYHRKGAPSSDHEHFELLSADEQRRVSRMSAILRLADALDREHRQKVDDVSVEIRDSKLVLTVDGTDDLLLERWALEKKADFFEKVFGLEVRMLLAGESD